MRGNYQDTAYYKEESEDDSIFHLIADASGTAYSPDENHFCRNLIQISLEVHNVLQVLVMLAIVRILILIVIMETTFATVISTAMMIL